MILVVLGLSACDDEGSAAGEGTDEDADGWSLEEGDCDDANVAVFPGALDIPYDGVDADCAGNDDEDADGDGGTRATDCNDEDSRVFSGAPEGCDGLDNDCDGDVDEEAEDAPPLYTDNDRDGFGVGVSVGSACAAIDGLSLLAGDCDDADPDVFPGQIEVCNAVDDDCSGAIDDAPIDGVQAYVDDDLDGYGDAALPEVRCTVDDGWSGTGSDCDDADPLSNPGATELCDQRDNDCDGAVDDEATLDRTWYPDGDGDGFGVATGAQAACAVPLGFAILATDCNDADATVYPRAIEHCDEVDDDCDGLIDEDGAEGFVWYLDEDGDGEGALTGTVFCEIPDGWLFNGGDCDDADPLVNTTALELCNGVDDNCDGAVDERTAADAGVWFPDHDADGFGIEGIAVASCSSPAGYAVSTDDCDDADDRVNPGARERCDDLDNDCDDEVDEDAPDAGYWYSDADNDGYGAGEGTLACTRPEGAVANDLDCDDGDAARRPGASESENGADDDCDALVDEDWITAGLVVVSEVTRQPYAGGTGTSTNANAQWFELYNPGASPVDLAGWYITEQDGDGYFVPPDQGLIVAPGGTLVFCYDDLTFADPTLCDWTWADSAHGAPWYDSTYYFDRDEDFVALYVAGVLIDEVHWTYDETAGYWPRSAKYAMRLDDNALDAAANDDVASWCNASASTTWTDASLVAHPDYGTPNAANGSCD